MSKPRKPAMRRSPKTQEELDALILWAFGPRVKVKFIDLDLDCRKTVEATFEIDGKHVGVHNGGLYNGCLVGPERHEAFHGIGWINGGLIQRPVSDLATDALKAHLEKIGEPWRIKK